MKRLLLVLALLAVWAVNMQASDQRKMKSVYNRLTKTWATYPSITVKEMEEANADSLLVADTIQNVASRSYIQDSPYAGDTVVVTCLVVVPPTVINYTAEGWTLLVYDTAANPYPWGGVFVRVNAPADTAAASLDGFNNVEIGDVIEMTGLVSEFPNIGGGILGSSSMNSTTQLQPIPGIAINIVGSQPIPTPPLMNASDFYHGLYQGGGTVQYSTGEPFENIIVQFTNLTYVSTVFTGPGREVFLMVDEFGNQITTYDCSRWFTTQQPNPNTGYVYRDPASTYSTPIAGSHLDSIRGFMFTASGGENNRGYRISPVFPGDIKIGNISPSIGTHRRNPVSVTPTDAPDISVKVTVGTFGLNYVRLYYRLNRTGGYTTVNMTYNGTDSLYHGTIPTQTNGTFVNYFFKVQDTTGLGSTLASAHPSLGADTTAGTYFYRSVSGGLTIYDLQYTPYISGYSGYLGSQVTVSGTITADTLHMGKTGLTGVGGHAWYIQSGNSSWNGIWVVAAESLMHGILNGDSILVRGTVGEGTALSAIVTQLYNIDSVAVIATGRPEPSPVTKTTGTFAFGVTANGSPTAEPYEGMLLRFTNLTVSNIYPYFTEITEYDVDDGSGPLRIRQDGLNSYSNVPGDTALGKSILIVGEKIDTLIGILHYSSSAWKLIPRTNDDFKMGHRYSYNNRWNMISVPRKVVDFAKASIYPNPPAASPAYAFEGSYTVKDTLKNGVGYWLKLTGNQNIRYTGTSIDEDTIDVTAGWNMIGSITDSIATSSVTKIPSSMVTSAYYSYNNGYVASSQIYGGKGYWVKADVPGQLVLSSGLLFKSVDPDESKLQAMNSITITDRNQNSQTLYFGPEGKDAVRADKYIMPPMPPLGGFDARFASQKMAELYPAEMKSEQHYPIKLSALAYPVTVSWTISDKDPNKSFGLTIVGSDKNAKSKQLAGSGTMVVKGALNDMLTLTIGKGEIPREFALGQNYPNPFNPTTKFVIAVPQTSKIELVVYDILGRKVKTLINEERNAGYHTIEWDGLNETNNQVATGVYFVRMSSDKFTAVRKIMMMK